MHLPNTIGSFFSTVPPKSRFSVIHGRTKEDPRILMKI
jgi:hypothetical protein